MKFGVVCDVEGNTYLERGGTLRGDTIDYIFYVEGIDEPRLKQIRLISDVDDPEQYSFLGFQQERFEQHIYEKLIQELQTLESVLALAGSIKRVYWNKAIFEYYPETEAELSRIKVRPAFFFIHEIPVNPKTDLSVGQLAQVVAHTSVLRPLNVPMSFMREAKNEYASGRYINAFYNSYFILEGLFGDGKSREREIVPKFLQSPVFTKSAQELIDEIAQNNDPGEGLTKDQLLNEFKIYNQPLTVEGLTTFLVRTRGRLHHFSIKNTQTQGTPFNHFQFKRIALIGFKLASDSLMYFIQEELNKARDNSQNSNK